MELCWRELILNSIQSLVLAIFSIFLRKGGIDQMSTDQTVKGKNVKILKELSLKIRA